ncbi:Early-phytochrome-responsive1 family protein, partial [Globisporangium splendens]
MCGAHLDGKSHKHDHSIVVRQRDLSGLSKQARVCCTKYRIEPNGGNRSCSPPYYLHRRQPDFISRPPNQRISIVAVPTFPASAAAFRNASEDPPGVPTAVCRATGPSASVFSFAREREREAARSLSSRVGTKRKEPRSIKEPPPPQAMLNRSHWLGVREIPTPAAVAPGIRAVSSDSSLGFYGNARANSAWKKERRVSPSATLPIEASPIRSLPPPSLLASSRYARAACVHARVFCNSLQGPQAQENPARSESPPPSYQQHARMVGFTLGEIRQQQPPFNQQQLSMTATTTSAPAVKRPFQELPRLHVPSHALAQQAQPMWKTSAPVIIPSNPPPPPAPRFQFFTNTVGGWFGRNNSPAKTLPSFHEILARTNQLQIVSQSDDVDHQQQQQQGDVEMMSVQAMAPAFPVPVPAGVVAPPVPPQPSYTSYAPQSISMHADVRPSLTVEYGTMEAQSPMGLASPVSQTSEASKRRERWTEEEHARFMEGLNRYGRKWKKIQTFVQTKTAVQVRTHAYGYFAKLLRNMPEDDGVWELAEEMSSLPGAVLKGPGNGKRRNEPKTDEEGMSVLRRFVFSKKKPTEEKKSEDQEESSTTETTTSQPSDGSERQQQEGYSSANWCVVEDSAASSAMLELKRQRIM